MKHVCVLMSPEHQAAAHAQHSQIECINSRCVRDARLLETTQRFTERSYPNCRATTIIYLQVATAVDTDADSTLRYIDIIIDIY